MSKRVAVQAPLLNEAQLAQLAAYMSNMAAPAAAANRAASPQMGGVPMGTHKGKPVPLVAMLPNRSGVPVLQLLNDKGRYVNADGGAGRLARRGPLLADYQAGALALGYNLEGVRTNSRNAAVGSTESSRGHSGFPNVKINNREYQYGSDAFAKAFKNAPAAAIAALESSNNGDLLDIGQVLAGDLGDIQGGMYVYIMTTPHSSGVKPHLAPVPVGSAGYLNGLIDRSKRAALANAPRYTEEEKRARSGQNKTERNDASKAPTDVPVKFRSTGKYGKFGSEASVRDGKADPANAQYQIAQFEASIDNDKPANAVANFLAAVGMRGVSPRAASSASSSTVRGRSPTRVSAPQTVRTTTRGPLAPRSTIRRSPQ